MGRTSNKVKNSNRLRQKSIDAFLLCLEIFNKPTINYRIESGSFLLCNAWELLLKSHYIYKNGTNSIYRTSDDKTFSLEQMLNKYYQHNSPIKDNLDFIIENIRNRATHYIIKEHDNLYLPLLQKAVLNYVDEIKKLFDIDIADYIPLESLALFIKKGNNDKNFAKLYGKSIADLFAKDEEEFTSFIQNSKNIDENYEVVAVVESKLAFVKNPDKAQIKAYYDKTGVALNEVIVSKDVEKSHPYNMKQVIRIIKDHLGKDYNLNGMHNSALIKYNKEMNIFNDPTQFKSIPYGTQNFKKYSQKYVDTLIELIKREPNKFAK